MKTLRDFLSKDEITHYSQEWNDFSQKYVISQPSGVHSGLPVLGSVYRFDDSPVFRAHVFQKQLRRFDPYYQAKTCLQPYWHATHFLLVAEQMYVASSQLADGKDAYSKKHAKDMPGECSWKRPVLWSDTISVELIREPAGKIGRYTRELGHFTFYSDKDKKPLSRMSSISYWEPRAFLQDIHRLKEGDESALDSLIRRIERQDINHSKLVTPRTTLQSTKEELISRLSSGEVPEVPLCDFFSLWD